MTYPASSGAHVLVFLATVVLTGCGGGSEIPLPPAPPPEDAHHMDVERLLDLAGSDAVLSARGRGVTRQVALLMGDPTDAELERLVPAVVDAFAPDVLRTEVVRHLTEDGSPELAAAALEWMESGATAAIRRIGQQYDPPQTLREYASEMTDEPPSEARVLLFGEWASARGEGDFFVLMQEALREAAVRIHGALRPGAPTFEPIEGEELEQMRASSHGAAVIRLLHAFEPAPDPLIRRSIAEYRSESGMWFTETYALAVARALRAAADRAVDDLSDRDGSPRR